MGRKWGTVPKNCPKVTNIYALQAIVEKELANIAGEIEQECKNNDEPDVDILSEDDSQYSDMCKLQ